MEKHVPWEKWRDGIGHWTSTLNEINQGAKRDTHVNQLEKGGWGHKAKTQEDKEPKAESLQSWPLYCKTPTVYLKRENVLMIYIKDGFNQRIVLHSTSRLQPNVPIRIVPSSRQNYVPGTWTIMFCDHKLRSSSYLEWSRVVVNGNLRCIQKALDQMYGIPNVEMKSAEYYEIITVRSRCTQIYMKQHIEEALVSRILGWDRGSHRLTWSSHIEEALV